MKPAKYKYVRSVVRWFVLVFLLFINENIITINRCGDYIQKYYMVIHNMKLELKSSLYVVVAIGRM